MDPREFLFFLKRRGGGILAMGLTVFVLFSFYAANVSKPSNQALIFLTLGLDLEAQLTISSEVAKDQDEVVDSFTETVQGWLFNPAFQARLNERVGDDVPFTARKQEKQNLIVTLTLPPKVSVEGASQLFLSLLEEEIQAYNAQTHATFVIALSSVTEKTSTTGYVSQAAVAGLIGLFLMGFVVLSFEYVTGRFSFFPQVKGALGKLPVKVVHSSSAVQVIRALSFVREAYPELEQSICIGPGPQSMELPASFHLLSYPESLKDIDAQKSSLLWIRLGHSTEGQLQELNSFLHGRVEYFVTF